MKKLYRAVVEGNLIKLYEKIDLPEGTETLVALSPVKKASEEEIKKRELGFLEKWFDMGKILYTKRGELYDT